MLSLWKSVIWFLFPYCACPRMLYKWNHTTWSFFSWVSFTLHLRVIHTVAWSVAHAFLLAGNIPLYGCTTVCSSTHQLKDIWVVPSFLQLWIQPLEAFIYKFCCELKFSFSFYNYLQVELQSFMLSLNEKLPKYFPKWMYNFVLNLSNSDRCIVILL